MLFQSSICCQSFHENALKNLNMLHKSSILKYNTWCCNGKYIYFRNYMFYSIRNDAKHGWKMKNNFGSNVTLYLHQAILKRNIIPFEQKC
jgi:hypothetical protein